MRVRSRRTRMFVAAAAAWAIGWSASASTGAPVTTAESSAGPASLLTAAAAAARDAQPTALSTAQPTATRRHQIVALTPRVWITQVNTFESEDFSLGAYFVPMYGGSLAITPPNTGFSLLVTGLYGEGEADVAGAGIGDGNADVTRADVELLLRYQVPDTPVIVFAGPRYVLFDQDIAGDAGSITDESQIVIGEIGVGVYGNIGASGRHRFFANFTVGVAANFYEIDNGIPAEQESDTEVSATTDLNLGYEYLVTGWASVNLRYRTFLLFGEDDLGQADMATVHGPELGVALRF